MKIAICSKLFFDENGPYKYRGEDDDSRQFRAAFIDLSHEIAAQTGNELFFVRIDDLESDGVFAKRYTVRKCDKNDNELRFDRTDSPFVPDVVINRRKDELYHHRLFSSANWTVYNQPDIAQLGNKAESLRLFSAIMPKSFELSETDSVEKIEGLLDANSDIKKWIVKPLRQSGGQGIELLDRQQVLEYVKKHNNPVLLQEFCETTDVQELGIKGRHDVRVYVIDGDPVLIAVRQPKAGGYLANTAAGGSIKFLDISLLPESARQLIGRVVETVNMIGRHYFISVDLFYTNNGWKMIEANDQPGIPAAHQTPVAREITKKMVKSMIDGANHGK